MAPDTGTVPTGEKNKITEEYSYGHDYFGRPRFGKILPLFPREGTILDFGCNFGIFLNVLRENGRHGLGIDRDPKQVQFCLDRGFRAVQADIFQFLRKPEHRGRYSGIMMADFVEHFDPQPLQDLLRLSAGVLQPGGVMAIITPNSRCLVNCAGGFYEPSIEHHNPYSINALRNFLLELGLEPLVCGIDPDSRIPLLTPHPARLLRNLSIWLLGRIICGRGSMYSHTYLVMRNPG